MPPVPTPFPVHPSLRAPCLLPTPRFSFAYRQREIRGRGAGFRAEFRARIPGAKIGPDSGAKRNSFFWVGDVGLFSGPESGSKIRPGMGRKLAGGGSLAVVEFPPRPGGGRQSSAED